MSQPNILLIVTDQLDPQMTGAYGHPVAVSPEIDRLAANGVRFNNAYSTCPVCAPARISLLTGRYLADMQCYDNGSILSAEEPTHNHYLNVSGYDTVLCGKAHFIGPEQLHGFQQRPMTDIYPADFHFMPARRKTAGYTSLHPNPIAVDYLGKNVGVRQASMQIDYDEETVFHAIKYLRSRRSQVSGTAQKPLPKRDDRPFFLQVSFNHPHEPFHVLQRHWDLYEGKNIPIPEIPDNIEETYTSMDRDLIRTHGSSLVAVTEPENLRQLHRAYLSSVSYLDEKVGQLRSALDEYGLTKDTIILLVSDHGDMLGRRGMVQKRCFYENSARIAMVAWFPPALRRHRAESPGENSHDAISARSGVVVNEPVSIADITPTLLELAGVESWLPMDGRSLIPLMDGAADTERYVFGENASEGVTMPCFMVRKGKWKFVYIHPDESQLFDLEQDPEELTNLAGSEANGEIEAELRKLILDRFDPERIDREAQLRFEKRELIQRSIEKTGTPSWNHRPRYDADHMYWRDEE